MLTIRCIAGWRRNWGRSGILCSVCLQSIMVAFVFGIIAFYDVSTESQILYVKDYPKFVISLESTGFGFRGGLVPVPGPLLLLVSFISTGALEELFNPNTTLLSRR